MPPTTKLPEHEKAYRSLRDMVLYGELAPGQPVTIQGLTETLGLGMTPVREAIRRLISQGALEFLGNRRVNVPEVTAEQHRELAFARRAIEPELARRAAQHIDLNDVRELEQVDASVDDAIERGDVRAYLESNHRFHNQLYRHSGATVLLALSETLSLRAGPSLRVMLGRHGTANLPDKHQEALAALKAGDPEAVALAIRDDIDQGIAQVERSLAQAGR